MSFTAAFRRLVVPSAACFIALPLLAGCGAVRPASILKPDASELPPARAMMQSPLAGVPVVILPLEVATGSVVDIAVLRFLDEFHQRTASQTAFCKQVFPSLSEAEKQLGKMAPLMIRGTVSRYAPTHQERWGDWVRVRLDILVKYDIWTTRTPGKTVTLWMKTAPEHGMIEYETRGGIADEKVVAAKIAELVQAALVRFDQDLCSSDEVLKLVR